MAQSLRAGPVLSDIQVTPVPSSAAAQNKDCNRRQKSKFSVSCHSGPSLRNFNARASTLFRSNDLIRSAATSPGKKTASRARKGHNAVKGAADHAQNSGKGSVGVIEEKPAPTGVELAMTEAPVKTLEELKETPDGRHSNGSIATLEKVVSHPSPPESSGQDGSHGIEVDTMAEADLKENGFRSTRRTKLMCTIGPACSELEQLEALAIGGMNVARLNMCHGTHAWHSEIIRRVRELNKQKGFSIAIMMDTEGSEIHMGDLGGAPSGKAEDGEEWTFTVRKNAGSLERRTIQVNYDGFVDDVAEGDEVVVDGGMVRFEVLRKVGPDVHCLVIDAGLLLPRANLTFWRHGRLVRERNAMLPTISSKDWIDIDFAIAERVDFLAISFVRTPDVIKHLRSYIAARSPDKFIALFSKIESSDSLKTLPDIIAVSDGAMVARGDLGAQIPLEQVPSVQQEIVHICRQLNKPVIVASQLLESMIEFPTPTRAEVADISEAVRQRADALMLSGESAMGLYPEKALGVLRTVATRIEAWCRGEKHHESMRLATLSTALPERVSEQVCNAASQMANRLDADAIFVYTRRGYMASLLSRNRPDCPIFAFTDSPEVRQRLNLYWGLIPFRLVFSEDMEGNLQRTFALLKARGMMKSGDLIVAVSDLTTGTSAEMLQSIQIRKMP